MERTSIRIRHRSRWLTFSCWGVVVGEQALQLDDCQAAALEIDDRHQRLDEWHQARTGRGLDLQHILLRQMQHRADLSDLSPGSRTDPEADQLSIVELPRSRGPLPRNHV